ncbi:MAG: hypothetical protein ACLU9R_07320 [Faecalibacterium sp.]
MNALYAIWKYLQIKERPYPNPAGDYGVRCQSRPCLHTI